MWSLHQAGFYLGFFLFFVGGGGDFEPHGGEKKFLGFLEGSEGMLPQIVFRIG